MEREGKKIKKIKKSGSVKEGCIQKVKGVSIVPK
jgi:hypothetical protein